MTASPLIHMSHQETDNQERERMNMLITNRQDFDSAVKNYRGPYPVLLTTDGETFSFKQDDNKDGCKMEGVVIDSINNSDLWPTFAEANRCLILAKKGWRGAELKDKLDHIGDNIRTQSDHMDSSGLGQ